MIAAWMLYSAVVGLLAAAAAAGAERVCSALRVPVRFAWTAALAATVILSGAALVRLQVNEAGHDRGAPELLANASAADVGVGAKPHGWLREVRVALGGGAARVYGGLARSPADARLLVSIWVATSLLLMLFFGGVLLRMRRARRRWRTQHVAGERIYVARSVGPALVGLRRPAIVVPEWLLRAPEADQRLAIRHEQEHRNARDHLLLAGACLVACLLPWNPSVWWMLRRTRLAAELDCDARVLRCGVHAGDYGALLLNVAARSTRLPLAALALSDTTTQLERRIVAMTEIPTGLTGTRPRTAAAAVAAVILAAAACSTDMPTAAEIDRMDVTAAQTRVEASGFLRVSDGTADPLFVIDDVIVSRDAAHALEPERIASIEVVKGAAAAAWGDAGANGVVKVTTREAGSSVAGAPSLRLRQSATRVDGGDTEGTRLRVRAADGSAVSDPLIIIDGVVAPPDFQLARLDPETIEAIEVLKGESAVRAYGERAAHGAIRITLKK